MLYFVVSVEKTTNKLMNSIFNILVISIIVVVVSQQYKG